MSDFVIPLSKGLFAIVDEADYEALSQFKWYAKSTTYAERKVRRSDGTQRTIIMHRSIMNPAPGLVVDHINHDGLDNRRANLRVCTIAENMRNRWSNPASSSRFLGVCWIDKIAKWQAQIKLNGQSRYLGCYADEIGAARAYDAAARELFGQFANPNFPLENAA